MKKWTTITLLVLACQIQSCDRLDGLDGGDRNTYTWKGRLVKDCNEEPASNVGLSLVGEDSKKKARNAWQYGQS